MKISKVNHRRTVVANLNEDNVRNTLYGCPKGTNNTEDVVSERIEDSKRFYSPFDRDKLKKYLASNKKLIKDQKRKNNKNTYNEQTVNNENIENRIEKFIPDECDIKAICNTFNEFVKQNVNLDNIKDKKIRINDNIVNLNQTKSSNELLNVCEEIVNETLNDFLLKKCQYNEKEININNTIAELMRIVCFKDGDKDVLKMVEIEKIDQDSLYALFARIIEDRDKENVLETSDQKLSKKARLVKSIDNQTTKTCVVNKDGKFKVELSAFSTKKHEGLKELMYKYANANEKEKKELQIELRKLIVLYICGSENYQIILDNKKLSSTSFKGYITNKDSYFIDISETEFKDDQKAGKKAEIFKVKNKLRYKIYGNYIIAKITKQEELKDKQYDDLIIAKYLLNHFRFVLEELFYKRDYVEERKLKLDYLCKYLWNDLNAYLSVKYIQLGKGVYNFAMPDLFCTDIQDISEFGVVTDENYKNGITGFDYERIKARESLDKSLAVAVSFASYNYSKSVFTQERLVKDNKEDALTYKDGDYYIPSIKNNDALRNVLMYFGGKSNYAEDLISDENNLFIEIKDRLYRIRNYGFHFNSTYNKKKKDNVSSEIIKLFNSEYEKLSKKFAEKYISNNVLLFYDKKDINKLAEFLYKQRSNRNSCIPSFQKVMKNKDKQVFVDELIDEECFKKINEENNKLKEKFKDKKVNFDDIVLKYRNTLYYILKEIYYHGFLHDANKEKKFDEKYKAWLKHSNELQNKENEENLDALNNFLARVDDLRQENDSFDYVCQGIMMDINMQNQGNKSIKSQDKVSKNIEEGKKKSYGHFEKLLIKFINELFNEYLNDEKFNFLRKPEYRKDLLNKELLNSIRDNFIQPKMYEDLIEKIQNNDLLLDWYVLAHFTGNNELNYLIGDIRSYLQFNQDIDRRAQDLNPSLIIKQNEHQINYEDVIEVLEYTLNNTGSISNNISDYFNDNDEYARYLANYVEFNGETFDKLVNFCKIIPNPSDSEKTIGLYCDEKNPIVNRNIVYSKMYGNDRLLKKCFENDKVNIEYINKYLENVKVLNKEKVFETNKCNNFKQQKQKNFYNNQKNRIELQTLTMLTEITKDLLAQLVSWCYLRERDLMYFQLGVNSMILEDRELDNKYRTIDGTITNTDGSTKEIHIRDGALLYQTIAKYTFELPIYYYGENNTLKLKKGCGAWQKQKQLSKLYGDDILNTRCLELFEIVKNAEKLGEFRNSIDHMRYMVKQDMSIMEYYSCMYKHFLIYDKNLQKSVTYIFKNILEKYKIIIKTKIMLDDNKDNNEKNKLIKEGTIKTNCIQIADDEIKKTKVGPKKVRAVSSDKNTYEFNGKQVNIEMYIDSTVLKQIKNLLNYKEDINV